jgi:hypothetical protein
LKPDDKGLKNSDSYVKPSIFTRIFESKRLLHDTPIFEPYDLIAGKLMPNTSYDVDSPLSKLAVVKERFSSTSVLQLLSMSSSIYLLPLLLSQKIEMSWTNIWNGLDILNI